MKKLSEKGRKVLRMIYRCLGVTAVSFIFQACYGEPMDRGDDTTIRGTVLDKKTYKPISGISIWVKDINYSLTDHNGRFTIYVPIQDNYTIVFTDIDGIENGLFQQLTMNVTADERASPLMVPMEGVAE